MSLFTKGQGKKWVGTCLPSSDAPETFVSSPYSSMDEDADEDMTDENIQCEGCKKDLTAPSSDPGGITDIIKYFVEQIPR